MGACLRYTTNRNRMMTRNRQMGGGLLEIHEESKSPNEGACVFM